MERRISSRIIGMCVLLAGCVAAWWLYKAHSQSEIQSAAAVVPQIPVEAGKVERADFPVYFYSLGQANAWNIVTVRSRVDGQITNVAYKEGEDIKAGDLLIEIDRRPFQATLDQANAKKSFDEALLANQKLDLDRYVRVGTLAATQQQIDTQRALVAQTEAQIRQDQAAIDAAQVQLSYTRITAPISGRVGFRLVDIGNVIHASDPSGVATITQVEPIAVIFTEPQELLPRIIDALKSGSLPVSAFTSDGKRELAKGELDLVDNQVDRTSGSIRLKARFANAEHLLWPGLTVSTRLTIDTLKGVVVIPDAGVIRGPNRLYAYVIKADGTVEPRDLKISLMQDGKDVVESGVLPGERVVTSGYYRVEPGSKVRITNSQSTERTSRGSQSGGTKNAKVE